MKYPARNSTDFIVIHGTWTRAGFNPTLGQIRDWHQQRGWPDIGYHFYIDRYARMFVGADLESASYHTAGYNSRAVAIALAGGRADSSADQVWTDNYTPAQLCALEQLIIHLKSPLLFCDAEVVGHSNLDSSKQCPGFDVREWYKCRVEDR